MSNSIPPLPPEAQPAPAAPPSKGSFWGCLFRTFLVLAILVGLGVGGFVYLSKYSIDSAKGVVTGVVDSFKPEEIAQSFVEWREMQTEATEGNILEVATSRSTEKMTRKTNLKMFNRVLPLGTTVSEVSIPATYRFHIDLNGDWHVVAKGQRIVVVAPRIAPSLPVAFDTSRMQKRTKSGWGRWDGDDNLEELEKTVTAKLNSRARAPETLESVRDDCRESVALFVQSWLLSRDHWDEKLFNEIVIVFEDEVSDPEDRTIYRQPATLKLDPPSQT